MDKYVNDVINLEKRDHKGVTGFVVIQLVGLVVKMKSIIQN